MIDILGTGLIVVFSLIIFYGIILVKIDRHNERNED